VKERFVAEIVLPGVAVSVPLARRYVVDALLAAGHREVDGARLITSELVGNAVVHTRSGRPGGLVAVDVVTVGEAMARIEVTDEGAATVPWPRTAGEDDCYGRGLLLVEQTSLSWGVRPTAMGWNVLWAVVSTLGVVPAGQGGTDLQGAAATAGR
jgi:anti-sigma regulatory factor (Ser/Thr protein kinase)